MKKKPRLLLLSKQSPQFDLNTALYRIAAQQFMAAERKLTPLIRADRMPPAEAIVLIVVYTSTMMGKDTTTEEEVIGATHLLLDLWKERLFVPGPDFPYSLQRVLEVMEGTEENE